LRDARQVPPATGAPAADAAGAGAPVWALEKRGTIRLLDATNIETVIGSSTFA
jgi:hypothetical protein